jgi:hypothetical protein
VLPSTFQFLVCLVHGTAGVGGDHLKVVALGVVRALLPVLRSEGFGQRHRFADADRGLPCSIARIIDG